MNVNENVKKNILKRKKKSVTTKRNPNPLCLLCLLAPHYYVELF